MHDKLLNKYDNRNNHNTNVVPKDSSGVIGKMKKMLNERGYALLIVLFTIIIFLSLSAVFMGASMNHVAQEQTVDKNNQAVVAAEMGTKKITNDIQLHINNKMKIINDAYVIKKNELEKCIKGKTCTQQQAETELHAFELSKVNEFYTYVKDENHLKKSINKKYANKIKPNLKLNNPIFKDQMIFLEKEVYFILNNIEVDNLNGIASDASQKYKIEISITGVSNGDTSELITATMEFEKLTTIFNYEEGESHVIIDSTNVNKVEMIIPEKPNNDCEFNGRVNDAILSSKAPYNCNLNSGKTIQSLAKVILESPKNLKLEDFNVFVDTLNGISCDTCGKGRVKDLTKMNIFVTNDVEFQNLVHLDNAQIYIDGLFHANNTKDFGNSDTRSYIVSKSLDIKQGSFLNTNIVLLGNKSNETKAQFSIFDNKKNRDGKFILNNSKFCIYLDKFDDTSKINVGKIGGSGEVIYFTKSDINFDDLSNGNLTFIPKTIERDFFDACDVDSISFEDKTFIIPKINEYPPVHEVINITYK